MRVLFFGTYDARRHPRVRVLQEGFRSWGDEVVECNAPLAIGTSLRVRMLRQPLLLFLLAARLAAAWVRLLWRSRGLGRFDAVVVGYLGQFDVHLARLRWPGIPIVLDHLVFARECALDRGVTGGPVPAIVDRLDRLAVAASDLVLVDTEQHAGLLPTQARERALVVPLGSPAAWFRAPRIRTRPLRIVFFGLYIPLQGTTVIGEALALLAGEPDLQVTMIGSGQELQAARKAAAGNPAVRWLQWVEPEHLPAVVASHDVCLGIFGTGVKAYRVVPHKVFEGAAAGCAIVTSDTLPQRALLGDAAIYVPPGNAHALAKTLRQLGRSPGVVQAARLRAYNLAVERFTGRRTVGCVRTRLLGGAGWAAAGSPAPPPTELEARARP